MRTVTLVLGPFEGDVSGDVIGVDYGALVCLNRGFDLMLACGDFDSVTEAEFQKIEAYARQTIRLKPEKDDTDFSFAYKQCADYDEILVVGGLGNRRDHEYTHIVTAIHDQRITIRDDINLIKYYPQGTYQFRKDAYDYFSVIVTEAAEITLEGFKYPLHKRSIHPGDTYLTSNEIVVPQATVVLSGGGALIIRAKRT